MPNYQNSKIYCIRSLSRPELIYIGASCRRLSERFSKHKSSTNDTSSKQIIDIGDAYIELIENYPCNSKEELNRREGSFVRSVECVNKNIPGRTKKEYQESEQGKLCQKKYLESEQGILNRAAVQKKYQESEKGKLIKKEYNESEQGKLNQKKYRESEQGKLYQKKYRKKYQITEQGKLNRAAGQKKYAGKKKVCECGAITSQGNIGQHKKTIKHIYWQSIYDFIYS